MSLGYWVNLCMNLQVYFALHMACNARRAHWVREIWVSPHPEELNCGLIGQGIALPKSNDMHPLRRLITRVKETSPTSSQFTAVWRLISCAWFIRLFASNRVNNNRVLSECNEAHFNLQPRAIDCFIQFNFRFIIPI